MKGGKGGLWAGVSAIDWTSAGAYDTLTPPRRRRRRHGCLHEIQIRMTQKKNHKGKTHEVNG